MRSHNGFYADESNEVQSLEFEGILARNRKSTEKSRLNFMAFACTKEKAMHSGELPSCIQSLIDNDSKKRILTIQVQFVEGEFHYWINTDARHLDGPEEIVNGSCDRVCQFCGNCVYPDCLDDYIKVAWWIIWKR